MWHTHLKKRAKPGKTDLEEQSSGELSLSSSSTLTGEVSAMEDQAQFLPDLLEMDGEEWWPEVAFLDHPVPSMGFSEVSSSALSFDGRTDASSEEDDRDFWLRVLMAAESVPEFPDF